MREMIDCGVEWIGSVPASWQTLTIGSLFKVRNEKVNDTDYPPLSVSKGGIVPQMENVAKSDANDNRKMVLTNDFVINSRSDRKQSCGVSPLDGSVSLINTVLYPAKGAPIVPAYLNYLLKNYGFAEEFYRWGHGIVADLWTTRWQEMKSILLPVPSVVEQQQILNAISVQTEKVDTLIANVQAQIEKLKAYKQSLITEVVTKGLDPTVLMKDSGVEWIGEIPEHWQLIRFRFIAKVTTGNQDTQNADPDGAYPFYVRSPIVERCNAYTFDGEGILMAGDGAGAGRVFHLVDGKYAVHQRVYRFYDFKYMNPVLLKYYLENLFSTVMDYGSAKTTVPSVRLPMIQDFCVCVPPENEQQEMISVLSYKTEKIDKLIALKEAKIEKLEQYKKSLIYEYVTGKKQVEVTL